MKSDNTPKDNLQSSWQIMKKLACIFSPLRFIFQIRGLYNSSLSLISQHFARFTPQDCIKSVRRCSNGRKRLGLVLNLTFTTKYYNPQDFERSRVHYGAIMCPGHEIPNEDLFWQFQRSLYNFFFDYPDRNMVVGVHCTHGVNRTGYMIAR